MSAVLTPTTRTLPRRVVGWIKAVYVRQLIKSAEADLALHEHEHDVVAPRRIAAHRERIGELRVVLIDLETT